MHLIESPESAGNRISLTCFVGITRWRSSAWQARKLRIPGPENSGPAQSQSSFPSHTCRKLPLDTH